MKNETSARWMVVDDNVDALKAVSRLLTVVSDAEICPFYSPWQALDAIAVAPETFQLVITDLEMPGMNGLDFRRHVHMVSPGTKVLLTTGSGVFTEESVRQNGFCGLLCKPFTIGALRKTLESIEAAAANFSKTSLAT